MVRLIFFTFVLISSKAFACANCETHPKLDICQPCTTDVSVEVEQGKMYIPDGFKTELNNGFVKFTFNFQKFKKPENIEIIAFEPSNLQKGYFAQLIKNSNFKLVGADYCNPKQKFEHTIHFSIK